MLKHDAIAHFGSQANLARALGIRQASISGWGETVPKLRQLQIETLTGGKLKADPGLLRALPQQQAWNGTERRRRRRSARANTSRSRS